MKLFFIFLSFFSVWMFLCCGTVIGEVTVWKSITVDQSGDGDYTTVQEAINSVPDNNEQWIRIHVKQGVYNEKVKIEQKKKHILLEGEGSINTVIQWDDHNDQSFDWMKLSSGTTKVDTWGSATFTVMASNFVARDIAFRNTYNRGGANPQTQAVAALLNGDKMSFYRCRFLGYQDTLCDFRGRHYFNNCWIEGTVDFIFGVAQSIYEKCKIHTLRRPGGKSLPGYITAHGREKADDTSGYVFRQGTITGREKTYLGRAWRPFSRVLFHQTNMADIIVPEGWKAWSAEGKEYQTTFAENECWGPGSSTSGRVKWAKNLSKEELNALYSDSYIDAEGWRSQQP